MRVQITFSLNLETGEASITPGSKKKMEELTTDGLMAMDLFGDIAGISTNFYESALRRGWNYSGPVVKHDWTGRVTDRKPEGWREEHPSPDEALEQDKI
jgi:hypothetical protein